MLTRKRFCSVAAVAVASLVAGPGLAACSQERGREDVLRVGTKIDVPGFGYENPQTGIIEGFEVDIAYELAERLYGSRESIEITGVNVSTRGEMLDSGKLDCVLATFTITEERKEIYNFSQPYYTDHIGIMVRKNSSIRSLADLDGKVIAVAASSTTKDKLEEEASGLGIEMFFAEYATYSEIMVALSTGRADAFSVDKSILYGYLTDSMVLLDFEFAPQEYGVATKKGNTDLAARIDEALTAIRDEGILDDLIAKWGIAG